MRRLLAGSAAAAAAVGRRAAPMRLQLQSPMRCMAASSAAADELRAAAQARADRMLESERRARQDNPQRPDFYIGEDVEEDAEQAAAEGSARGRGPRTYKRSTFLTGVPVDPDGRQNLLDICDDVLARARELLPEGTSYREHLEQNYGYMRAVALQNEDIATIESEIEKGQIELLIDGAKEEFELVKDYADRKMWEQVEEYNQWMEDPANYNHHKRILYPQSGPAQEST